MHRTPLILPDEKKLHYRIYRSAKPVDSVEGLAPIAKVKPLTCWNIDYSGVSAQKDNSSRFTKLLKTNCLVLIFVQLDVFA